MHSNGKITAPVGLYDIMVTLGENRLDAGTLCTSAKINPIAKYKPIYNSPKEISPNYWKGHDGNCSLAPYGVDLPEDIPLAYNDEDNTGRMNGWEYLHPLPSHFKSPWQFDGYDHNAVMAAVSCASEALTTETKWPLILAGAANDAWLTPADIAACGDGYLGVYAAAEGEVPFYCTAQQKVSEMPSNVATVEINWKNRAGLWTLYPIICRYPKTQDGVNPSNQKFFTVPYASPKDVTVTATSDALYVYANAMRLGNNTVRLTLVAVNSTKNAVDFKTVYWQMKADSNTLVSTDKTGTWAAGSVAAGSSKSTTVDVYGSGAFIQRGYAWVRVYSGNSVAGIGEFNAQVFFGPNLDIEVPEV